MRRALVTGATGGLGIELVSALLSEGYEVRATGRNWSVGDALRERGASFMQADLTAPEEIEKLVTGIDVVFHAAALASPWGYRAAFRAINVDATRRLIAGARFAGCSNLVFISTPSVYSEARDRFELTETSSLAVRFANFYTETKYEAERLVLDANGPAFSTVVLRPRALVGPHDRVLLPRLLQVARSGRFPLFRNGSALTELTDVRDAVAAVIAADRRRADTAGRVFNISGGSPATVADTLGEIFGALQLRPKYFRMPYALAAMLCRGAEAMCARLPGRPEPLATVYGISTLTFSMTFDLTAARSVLGWQPRYTPQEAIARTAAAWGGHAAV